MLEFVSSSTSCRSFQSRFMLLCIISSLFLNTIFHLLILCFAYCRYICHVAAVHTPRLQCARGDDIADRRRLIGSHLARAQNGRTALIWAVQNGRTACARLLLDAGADMNVISEVRTSAGRWRAGRVAWGGCER